MLQGPTEIWLICELDKSDLSQYKDIGFVYKKSDVRKLDKIAGSATTKIGTSCRIVKGYELKLIEGVKS